MFEVMKTRRGFGGVRRGIPQTAAREDLRAARRVGVVGVVVALLMALCVPGAHASAAEGSIDLGLSVVKKVQPASGDAGGSVDLGINVGLRQQSPAASAGSVDVGIALDYLRYHEVSFVGYYCDAEGNIVSSKESETIQTSRVAQGESPLASAPSADALKRVDDWDDNDGTEYWADVWYTQNPAACTPEELAKLKPVSLDAVEVTGDTVLWCLWKKGYIVKLDPNNGDDGHGNAVFDGAVTPGYVSVERNAEYDEALATGGTLPDDLDERYRVDHADFPVPTRDGYVFAGWYDPATENGKPLVDWDDHGRIRLGAEVVGVPVAGQTGTMRYEEFYEHKDTGRTLYAKWELDRGVEIKLKGVRDASSAEVPLSIWHWTGRGYVLERPYDGMEVDPAATIIDAAGAAGLNIERNPIPDYPTQYFIGWGYGDDSSHPLVTCEKDEATGAYAYALAEAAFAEPYVKDGAWADVAHTTTAQDEATGEEVRCTEWIALFGTAPIRVSAPFEVTFDIENPDDADNPLPYPLERLEYVAGVQERIYSSAKDFRNYSDQAVFVSGIECLDVGASAILPGGAAGAKIFSLGKPDHVFGDASSIRFGYASASGANKVSLGAYDPDRAKRGDYLVLPAAADADHPGVATLRYGLDLQAARFNKAAIAVGDAEDSSYIAKVANVKYTYSVVP